MSAINPVASSAASLVAAAAAQSKFVKAAESNASNKPAAPTSSDKDHDGDKDGSGLDVNG